MKALQEKLQSHYNNKLDEKLIPAHVRDINLAGLEALTQGNLTVLQYEYINIELSCYVEDLIVKE